MSNEEKIRIPDELRELYLKTGRPRPLFRAERLERFLNLPEDVKIFYKREDLSPSGSHKMNTALAQAYYAKNDGKEMLTTETGAGQWGSALSIATSFFDLKCKVFMVKASFEQKPYRKTLMNLFGADVVASPSMETDIGKKLIEEYPGTTGSLGMAISEAVEAAVKDKTAAYTLGSVLNHVMIHQSIIGLETKRQIKTADENPDVMIGCVGGGSNFAGLTYPFIKDKITGKSDTEFLAVEPTACPTLTRGDYRYDFGDAGKLTPLMKMYTLGCGFVPDPIHAGGLRYHGDAPSLCLLKKHGLIDALSYGQDETFEAGRIFARTEGIVPAPETNFAIKAAIDQAIHAKKNKDKKTIIFGFSGHGHFDLAGYQNILNI